MVGWLRGMGLEHFSFLARELPGFRLKGDQIRVIYEPKDFYQVGYNPKFLFLVLYLF